MAEELRPDCALCAGPIPEALLSERDIQAEKEYARERRQKPRPFYCSMGCLNEVAKAHSQRCRAGNCNNDWCGTRLALEARQTA